MRAVATMDHGQAENRRGHKPLAAYDLPIWCNHPLRPAPQRVAVLFPGEQSQYVGMCGSCKELPAVQQMLQSASTQLGFDIEELMREDPQEKLDRVDNSQLLTYVANCAAFEVLKQEATDLAKPFCVAGFSVGVYSALFAAEVFTFEEGLRLVKARAEATRRWSEGCSMQALGISGVDVHEVKILCADAMERDLVDGSAEAEAHVSHIWGRPTGVVCSGRTSTLQHLQKLVEGYDNAFVQVLDQTRVALQTPMAQAVVSELEEALQTVQLRPPKCNVYFNSGQVVASGEHPDLVSQGIMAELTTPLCWDTIVHSCLTKGVARFVECGPGQSLADLMPFNEYTDVRRSIKPAQFTQSIKV